MGKRDEVYENIGRETFEKICKEEVKPLYIDPCKPPEDFSKRVWITREEAVKIWPK